MNNRELGEVPASEGASYTQRFRDAQELQNAIKAALWSVEHAHEAAKKLGLEGTYAALMTAGLSICEADQAFHAADKPLYLRSVF